MKKLTVSIVNYNAGQFLIKCLESLHQAADEADLDIYIVDNASTDDSIDKAREKFSDIRFILNDKNLGFGRANNQVLKRVTGGYILILNPDVEVPKLVIKTCLDYFEKNPNIGFLTPKVVFPSGRTDLTAHRGSPTPLASFLYYGLGRDLLYHLRNRDFSTPHEVDSIAGAFMLTHKNVLDKIGLFDEDFFLYGEDIDLCLRAKKAGYKVMYLPSIKVIHHKGISSGLKKHSEKKTSADLETRKKAFLAFFESMKIFYKKHYEKKYPFFINWLVYLGINLKLFLAKRKMQV